MRDENDYPAIREPESAEVQRQRWYQQLADLNRMIGDVLATTAGCERCTDHLIRLGKRRARYSPVAGTDCGGVDNSDSGSHGRGVVDSPIRSES